ncbi:hypothetical protein AUR04nite_08070 [Glutamicibacter uratoxydans]|uniref:LigA protein n=1 Tax=Glutamicibacter uratoxydans TaxID=43667 RepID=A0A4Y4DNN8_GLUUR|nr:hypothetical protein AUR04nite_08070 [Glutamicibacter uratoxydans]
MAVLTAIGVLPYFLLKLAWIFGSQWGIESPSKLDGTVVLMGNIITASLDVLLVAIVVALGRRAALKIPWWLILIPAWFAAGLLLPFIFTGPVIAAMVASGSGSSDGSLSDWVGPLVYLSFGIQAIGVVLVLGWYLRRRWGRALESHSSQGLVRVRTKGQWAVFSAAGVVAAALVFLGLRWIVRAATALQAQSADLRGGILWLSDVANAGFAACAVIGLLVLVARRLGNQDGPGDHDSSHRWWPILLLSGGGAAIAGSALYALVLMSLGAGTAPGQQDFWELSLSLVLGLLCGLGALAVIVEAQKQAAAIGPTDLRPAGFDRH